MLCRGVGFFEFIQFEIHLPPWICKFMVFLLFLPHLGSFQSYCFKYFFISNLSSPSWKSNETNDTSLVIFPQVSDTPFVFNLFILLILLLLFRMDRFYWSIFQFTDSILQGTNSNHLITFKWGSYTQSPSWTHCRQGESRKMTDSYCCVDVRWEWKLSSLLVPPASFSHTPRLREENRMPTSALFPLLIARRDGDFTLHWDPFTCWGLGGDRRKQNTHY